MKNARNKKGTVEKPTYCAAAATSKVKLGMKKIFYLHLQIGAAEN